MANPVSTTQLTDACLRAVIESPSAVHDLTALIASHRIPIAFAPSWAQILAWKHQLELLVHQRFEIRTTSATMGLFGCPPPADMRRLAVLAAC
jgi:hypothetical protein